MNIDIVVQAEDLFMNKIYFIREKGHWRCINKRNIQEAFSNFSSNSAELYIDLENSETKSDAIRAINKHADFIKKNSAK